MPKQVERCTVCDGTGQRAVKNGVRCWLVPCKRCNGTGKEPTGLFFRWLTKGVGR